MLLLSYTLPHLRSGHDLAKICMLLFVLILFFPPGVVASAAYGLFEQNCPSQVVLL